MSEPSTLNPVSLSASGYEDGLGRRTLEFDREAGVMLERLYLRPELGAFEAFLRDRVALAMSFDDERFARATRVERDARNVLTVVSPFVAGNRLCDLLEAATTLPADEASCPSVDAAIGFLLEVLPALASLHAMAGHAHGTLAPGRIVLTPASQVVILDSSFGQAIERLQFNRRRLWVEFGVAAAPAAGPARLDMTADIAQASLAAMMIVLGRPLRENEYPEGLPTLLNEVIEIAQIRGSGQFATDLQTFLQRTLPLPGRRPHAGADEAADEVRQIASEIGVSRCRAALTAFTEDMNRVLEMAREETEDAEADPADEAIYAAVDAFAADLATDSESAVDGLGSEAEYAPGPDVLDQTAADPDDALESAFGEDSGASAPIAAASPIDIAEPFVDHSPEPEPFSVVEPEIIPEPAVVLQPESVAERVVAVEAESGPTVAREPRLAEMIEPESAPPPAVVAAPEPAPVETPKPQAQQSKRKRRGSKAQRDKLRSNALPAPRPSPVMPVPAQPVPFAAAPAVRQAPPMPSPIGVRQAPAVPSPIGVRPAPAPKAPLRVKAETPRGYEPPPVRQERREPAETGLMPYPDQGTPASSGEFPWRLAAAAAVVMLVIVGVGRAYLPDRAGDPDAAEAIPEVAPKRVNVAQGGNITVKTQPAGAHVLLDGKAVGDTPLTLEAVTPGRHALTFVTSAGSVKKIVRVEAGKSISLDIPIYSGLLSVFSPIALEIAENGRSIGTTEQGRLTLSPGRHQLTLTNRQLGYKGVEIVEIEPGEERSISVQPTGELNVNADPWADIWMNGKKVGETPVAGLQVPLGTHEIVFKNPQFPDRRVTITVTALAPAIASVTFSK